MNHQSEPKKPANTGGALDIKDQDVPPIESDSDLKRHPSPVDRNPRSGKDDGSERQ